MESTWTVRSYLESQRVNGLKWSEKNLRDDIGTFLGRGEAVNRAVAQHLRVILLKNRKVNILLESETHHKFLDQKRSFNAIPSVSPVPVLPNSNIQHQVWKGIEEVIICDLQYQNGRTKKGRISWMCKHYQPKSNESVLNLWEQPKSTESLVKCEEKKLLCHLQVPSLLFSRTVSNLYHSLLLQVQRLFHWGL